MRVCVCVCGLQRRQRPTRCTQSGEHAIPPLARQLVTRLALHMGSYLFMYPQGSPATASPILPDSICANIQTQTKYCRSVSGAPRGRVTLAAGPAMWSRASPLEHRASEEGGSKNKGYVQYIRRQEKEKKKKKKKGCRAACRVRE